MIDYQARHNLGGIASVRAWKPTPQQGNEKNLGKGKNPESATEKRKEQSSLY